MTRGPGGVRDPGELRIIPNGAGEARAGAHGYIRLGEPEPRA